MIDSKRTPLSASMALLASLYRRLFGGIHGASGQLACLSSATRLLHVLLGLGAHLVGQGVPSILYDIRNSASNFNYQNPTSLVGGAQYVLFAASVPATGIELYASNGNQTFLSMDIRPGVTGSYPGGLVQLGTSGTYLFAADDGVHGRELWSVHPPASPVLLLDIQAGPVGSDPDRLTLAGNQVFFFATTYTAGNRQLWKSDGTASGTVQVSASPNFPLNTIFGSELTPVGNSVFFVADNGIIGNELYFSDGTASGTSCVADLTPGSGGSLLGPRAAFQGQLLFTRSVWNPYPYEAYITELWRANGAAGATIVYTFSHLGGYSVGEAILAEGIVSNSAKAFLTLSHDDNDPLGLGPSQWRDVYLTDGTSSGTLLSGVVADHRLRVANDRVFALIGDLDLSNHLGHYGQVHLAVWDQPSYSWLYLHDVAFPGYSYQYQIGRFVFAANRWLFGYDTGVNGSELWATDCTPGGTALLRDLFPGWGGAFLTGLLPTECVGPQSALYFSAGTKLWTSDGTAQGTQMVSEIQSVPDSNPLFGKNAMGASPLVFSADDGAHGAEVWRTDGTAGGTALVADLRPGVSGASPSSFAALGNGRTVFLALDATGVRQLFCTDGTAVGTNQLTSEPSTSVMGNQMVLSGSVMYFTMSHWLGSASTGIELWRTNGTQSGTYMVLDIVPGTGSSTPSSLTDVNGTLYFAASNGTGRGLWRSDGTTAGTVAVANGVYMDPQEITLLNGYLYFSGTSSGGGTELWRSDGTAPGTQLFVDIRPGSGGSSPDALIASDNLLFFQANDGTHGRELWVSDGTSAGTHMVADLTTTTGGGGQGNQSNISLPTAFRGGLLFTFNDHGAVGEEPWFSDGTTAGTHLVADVYSGSASSMPSGSSAFFSVLPGAGRALFSAFEPVHGSELWQTDGTAIGTSLFADINPGAGSAIPGLPVLVGGNLVFAANDGVNGREPWVAASMAASIPFGQGCGGSNLRVPRLSSPDAPTLGYPAYRQQLDFAAPAAFAYLGIDFSTVSNVLGYGCELYIGGSFLGPVPTDATGRFTACLPIPNATWMIGLIAYTQYAIVDPAGPYLGWSVSNAMKLVINSY